MASVKSSPSPTSVRSATTNLGRDDQTLLLFARLMEGGREDEDTVQDLDALTRLLNDDAAAVSRGEPSILGLIDADCADTIFCYLDMRQPDLVRGHAVLTTSAYFKAAGDAGNKRITDFFQARVRRGTYDDYIVAFCVAASIFPIVPDLTAKLFLSEGFLASLGPLMRRKWKSRKVETACLEMLNAACMQIKCREAVQKYCTEWLEEIVDQDPAEVAKAMFAADPDLHVKEGSISMRRHSQHVQKLAVVVLAKLRAVQPPRPPDDGSSPRITAAMTSIEDLSRILAKMMLTDPEYSSEKCIEGLAYASLRPTVKEEMSKKADLLRRLVEALEKAPPRSPQTYGALSIFVNLTHYKPQLSEEEKKMEQLKAYANATGTIQMDPLDDDAHVSERCKRVFAARLTPVLVAHSKNGSAASLALVVSVIYSLSVTASFRGQLAQQGAVRLLISAWNSLSAETGDDKKESGQAARLAAQALARILISANPAHVFGGTRTTPQSAAIRPLTSIVASDPVAETRDLLPTFEAIMALTNLASTDDDNTRRGIVRAAWPAIEELLLSRNPRVATAAVELVCNLVQGPDAAVLYCPDPAAPTSKDYRAAEYRLHVLVALADAEDDKMRSAAGGALAGLTGMFPVARCVAALENGPRIVLGLCAESTSDDLRHRGAAIVLNMVMADGEAGQFARNMILEAGGVEVLQECVKQSRRAEAVQAAMQALRILSEQKDGGCGHLPRITAG